ncbi:ABC transporter permease [Mucilaginibacter sp. OK098]|uniref:ABC transporter permease n=1 Tax=Mucilaginibacter sp. OK098 TaxID=1855297 RepID=UPI000924122C|nr:ABC transporter permease [Mucilaginibacter sp. OK098]SHM07747.1 duplicated orphan permease [Mucilaginibacter sp. OK098]
MIRNYFKTAWRNITRNKVYTAINVLGLSLGICACLVIYLITSFELSYDNFHPDKERIYRIVARFHNPNGKADDLGSTISALPITIRNEVSGFENVTAFYNYAFKVTIPDGSKDPRKFDAAEDVSSIIITEPQYFNLFKYQWLAGNAVTALKEPFKVVLSETEVQKYFGNVEPQNVIGRNVTYNDSLHLTVSGVVKDWSNNTDFGFKDFVSFATIQHSFLKNDIDLQHWGMWDYNSQGYVKLAKGVTPAQIAKQFPAFVKAHVKMPPGFSVELKLQPLADVHFNSAYEDSYTRKAHLPTLYALIGIALFILVIAVINFVNLSTAQSLRRAKEVGVRKVLGGSKSSLTVQFLIETFFVTIVAVFVSVMMANPVLAAFHNLIPPGVTLDLLSAPVLIFLVSVTIFTGLLAGIYPARVLSSYLPVISLKGEGSQKLNGKSYLRKSLIVFQFTVSLVFIIGTVVIGNQIHFILNKDLGFNKDAIISIRTGWNNTSEQLTVYANKIKQLQGVQLITRHRTTPAATGHPGTYMSYKGATGENKIDASFDFCDENYVPLFGLKIVAGRNLRHADTLTEFLVNETCAKALGFKRPADALGKIVEVGINKQRRAIVGIVKDFHSKSLHEAITPFFLCSIKDNERTLSIKLATAGKQADDFKKTISQIEQISKEIYPNEKFEYKFFDETIANLYEKEQKTAKLMSTAMGIAIFISCMGLFGLATFTAQQRVKEIGIRKVLGASASSIVSMLSRDFISLVMIAILIASPIAYYFMHLWLQDFAYRVNISWWIFLVSGVSAILIALVTISFQSVKAALANPVKSLRSE